MSGHSKWSTIKHKKAARDTKRAGIFSKLARAITVAARGGGGEIETNYELRSIIEKAKSVNMPKENITRAIKKGTGKIEGEQLEELLIEAYGPGDVAILIEAVTDNKNRTTSEIRTMLMRHGARPVNEGSVKWLFERKMSLTLPSGQINNPDAFELIAIDAGAEDIIWQKQEDVVVIYINSEKLKETLNILEKNGYAQISTNLDWVAKEEIKVSTDILKKLELLYEALDEQEEVQEIYSNAR